MGYLMNYDGEREDFRVKDLFSKDGREKITEEIKDKHPKIKKALDKHPGLEKAVKGAMVVGTAYGATLAASALAAGVYFAGPAIAGVAGTGGAATAAGNASALAVFKPAMTAVLKSNGQKTNGLPLKDVIAKFLKLKGTESLGAESDFPKIAEFFGKIKDKVNGGKGSEADKLLSDLIDGTAKNIIDKGGDFVAKMITGDDAANDTPKAQPEPGPAPTTKDSTQGGGMNIGLIIGALVLVFILAKK